MGEFANPDIPLKRRRLIADTSRSEQSANGNGKIEQGASKGHNEGIRSQPRYFIPPVINLFSESSRKGTLKMVEIVPPPGYELITVRDGLYVEKELVDVVHSLVDRVSELKNSSEILNTEGSEKNLEESASACQNVDNAKPADSAKLNGEREQNSDATSVSLKTVEVENDRNSREIDQVAAAHKQQNNDTEEPASVVAAVVTAGPDTSKSQIQPLQSIEIVIADPNQPLSYENAGEQPNFVFLIEMPPADANLKSVREAVVSTEEKPLGEPREDQKVEESPSEKNLKNIQEEEDMKSAVEVGNGDCKNGEALGNGENEKGKDLGSQKSNGTVSESDQSNEEDQKLMEILSMSSLSNIVSETLSIVSDSQDELRNSENNSLNSPIVCGHDQLGPV